MIAGVLRYLANQSSNIALIVAANVASFGLLVYCLSYINAWTLQPFHPMKNQLLARWLNFAANFLVIGGTWIVVSMSVPAAIDAMARGQDKSNFPVTVDPSREG